MSSNEIITRMIAFVKRHENFQAFSLYIFFICVVYAPVVFLGKSLQPPLYHPLGATEQGAYGYNGRMAINTFNVDLGSGAYYEWPLNKLVGDFYRQGQIPLWNPYQAAGAPLAAEFASRVFFPYQIIEVLSPNWTWDYFMLGRLLIAGFFTFLFLRLLRLSFSAALLGGIFYMFSGAMVWWINFEELPNVAMMVPVHLFSLELLVQDKGYREIALAGIVAGLVLLAGQPEIALYVFFLGAAYFIFRVFMVQNKINERVMHLLRLCIIFALGLGLSAPVVIPFLDYANNYAHNLHHPGGGMGVTGTTSWQRAVAMVSPTSIEMPIDIDNQENPFGVVKSLGREIYFRLYPINGDGDGLGGYSGILPVFLIFTGLFIGFLQKDRHWLRCQLFFVLFGLVIIFKSFGFIPFHWLGYLPLFDQVWSPKWAGPTWNFSFAVAGAIGWHIVREHFLGKILPDIKSSLS